MKVLAYLLAALAVALVVAALTFGYICAFTDDMSYFVAAFISLFGAIPCAAGAAFLLVEES